MRTVLVDTSVVIEFLRTGEEKRVQTSLVKLTKSGSQPVYSILTYFESYSGKSVWEKDKARQTVDIVFEGRKILALDKVIALKAGEIRARLNLSSIDALIATTALYHQLPLLSLNRKDFAHVPGLKLFDEK